MSYTDPVRELLEMGRPRVKVWPDYTKGALDEEHVNGFLIGNLLDLDAVEAASIIEAACDAHRVDLWINGDWEDVQVELGLKSSRATRRRTGSYRKLKRALEGPGSSERHEGREGKKA